MFKKLCLLIFWGLLLIGCSENRKKINESVMEDSVEIIPAEAPLPKVSFYQYEPVEDSYPDAILELFSPLGNQVFKPGKVAFEFNIKNYPFEEASAEEFRLFNILNGGDPVGFGTPIFQRELTQGSYRVVAYLVDDEGLALKNFGNYVDRDFQVGDSRPFPYSAEPYLAVNYPRNNQIFMLGEEVIVDFLVIGGDMELDDLMVSVSIGNEYSYIIDQMDPIRVANLPAGSYQVKVKLLKGDEKELEGPFSSVSKSIIVR